MREGKRAREVVHVEENHAEELELHRAVLEGYHESQLLPGPEEHAPEPAAFAAVANALLEHRVRRQRGGRVDAAGAPDDLLVLAVALDAPERLEDDPDADEEHDEVRELEGCDKGRLQLVAVGSERDENAWFWG